LGSCRPILFLNIQIKAWLHCSSIRRRNGEVGPLSAVNGALKPGVTLQQAQAELDGIGKQLEIAYPDYNKGWGVNLVPMHEQIVGDIRPVPARLLAAVAFVLLIAVRETSRTFFSHARPRDEKSWRYGRPWRGSHATHRQMLTESMVLAMMGGVLGVLLAYWGTQLLVAFAPDNIPRLHEITLTRASSRSRSASHSHGSRLRSRARAAIITADLNDALKEGARGSSSGNRVRP